MENFDSFALRHIGLSQADIDLLLGQLGYKDLEEFSKSVIPKNILIEKKLGLSDAMSEEDALKALKEISKKKYCVSIIHWSRLLWNSNTKSYFKKCF